MIYKEREREVMMKRVEHFERVMRQRQLGNWLRVRNFLVTFNLCQYIYYLLILLILLCHLYALVPQSVHNFLLRYLIIMLLYIIFDV